MFRKQWWRANWWWLGLMGVGIFLRLWRFGHVPVSLYWDEMAMWNDARSIATTGKDLFARSWLQPLFISYGDFKMPVMIWMIGVVSFLVRDPFVAVRLPSLLAGLLALPLAAVLLHDLLPPQPHIRRIGSRVTLVVAALLPWTVHFSRVGFEGHVGAVALLASVVSLLRLYRTQRWWWVPLWIACGLLAVYSYFSVRYVWPVISLGTLLFVTTRTWRRMSMLVIGGLLVWGLGLVPMMRGDFYKASNEYRLSAANILSNYDRPHVINAWRMEAGNSVWSRLIYNEKLEIGRTLFGQYLAYLDPAYLFVTGDPNARHTSGISGIMLPIMAPFFLLGVRWWAQRSPRAAVFLALWWVAGVLPAAVPLDVPHALRSLNVFPVMIAVVTGGGLALAPWWRRWWLRSVLAGLLVTNLAFWSYTMFALTPRRSAAEWQDGYWQLAQEVARVRDHYVFVYVDGFDARFFLYYQPWSGLSWSEIQRLESKDFRRTTMKNVVIDTIDDWETLEHNSIVFTTRSRVPDGHALAGSVAGAFGEERFVYTLTPRD